MQLFNELTNENFAQCWKAVEKEVIKRDRAQKTAYFIAIPGMVTMAVTLFLISACLSYLMFKSENLILSDFALLGQKIYSLISFDLPQLAIYFILLLSTIVLPFAASLIARIFAGAIRGSYRYGEQSADILGALKMKNILENLKGKVYDVEYVWAIKTPVWMYLLYSLILVAPFVISLIYGYNSHPNHDYSPGLLYIVLPFLGIIVALLGCFLIIVLFSIQGVLSRMLQASAWCDYDKTCDEINYYINKTKAAEQAEAERIQKEKVLKEQQELLQHNLLKGQKLYEEAIASNPADEELLNKAAKLGHPAACCYVGKKILSEWTSNMYTIKEKEQMAKDAAKCFDVARQIAVLSKMEFQTECTFLWLFSRLQYETASESDLKDIVNMLRSIRHSGKLPEEYHEMLTIAIQTAVNNINELEEPVTTSHTSVSSSANTSLYKGTSGNSSPGLNTHMTIRGTNKPVYYNNGRYVDESGNTVPITEIDD